MTTHRVRPLVVVDARLAHRRGTGIARVITRTRNSMRENPPPDLDVLFADGPRGLPRRNVLTSLGNLIIDMVWLGVLLPRTARKHGAALIHSPMNWGPVRGRTPITVMIQDLAYERMPESYPAPFRMWASLLGRRTARRATLVMATTRAGLHDVQEIYRVPSDRIRVVPLGADADGQPDDPPAREPFILAVGEFEPRKRVLDLMTGHGQYVTTAPSHPPVCRLVVAGGGGSQEDEARGRCGPNCDLVGFVSDDALADLYRRATLFVSLSAYEGFGLPIVEAMAHGCPVLVANNSSQAEVAGDGAFLIDDPSPEGLAAALTDVLSDRAELARRGEAARARAAELTWDMTARRTADVWREALGLTR
ncbi:MAG: glycosyltransferase family 1 protein [Thermoleophilia bacterium]|nr:glycosyltransferase family 1 protein [Thermoleophilia bacterium]